MPNISVSIAMPEESTMEEAVELSDEVLQRISQVEGIATAGAMMNSGTALLGGGTQSGNNVTVYITLDDQGASGAAVGKQIEQLCADMPCTVSASSAMMDMSMLTGSGISLNLFSEDMDTLQSAARKAGEVLEGIEGVAEVSNGLEEAAPALHVAVDRNKAMEHGLTVAQFQSLKSPFIVMFTIPLAFTGGFLALLVCGMEFSVISLIGFVMLTGIIVNNGIVLVDYVNQLRLDGMERRQALVEAGVTRMRPILMTTITTILGLIDMAVRKTAGTSLMQPTAVVCIGGLTYATLMTLYVVPCIYDALNKKELRKVDDEDLKMLDL